MHRIHSYLRQRSLSISFLLREIHTWFDFNLPENLVRRRHNSTNQKECKKDRDWPKNKFDEKNTDSLSWMTKAKSSFSNPSSFRRDLAKGILGALHWRVDISRCSDTDRRVRGRKSSDDWIVSWLFFTEMRRRINVARSISHVLFSHFLLLDHGATRRLHVLVIVA